MDAVVFLSYATPDVEAAAVVRDDLEADGIRCWIAPRDVPAGADYAQAIVGAIAGCRAVVLLLTAASNASKHIEREAHLAVSQGRPILPVRLEDVKPAGALEYLLANAQWIDAFPRLEPGLVRIRTEVRRLLQQADLPVPSSGALSRFQRVLASAGAWSVVLALMVLLLMWIQRVWFNLVPMLQVPLVAAQRVPLLLVVPAIVPAAAMAAQYWYHRNVSHIASLDALFGLGAGTGVRTRLAVAAGLVCILVVAIGVVPPTVSIHLEAAAIGQYNAELTRLMTAPGEKYVTQQGHYAILVRVGSFNPEGQYTLRLELSPYATRDGVEFGDLLVDTRFGIEQAELVPDDPRRAGYVDLRGPLDSFLGERVVRLTATHYRDTKPAAPMVAASITLANRLRIDAKSSSIPNSAFPAE